MHTEQIQLEQGDILLLYTDGVTEAANQDGILLNSDGLADVIRPNINLSAEQLIQKVLRALKDFTNGSPLADDVTLVVSKVK